MNTQRSSAALRLLIVAAVSGVEGDSLNQLNSSELPDGAEVFVISTRSVYRLNKTSTVVANATTVIAPNGGPGRFVYESGAGGSNAFLVNGTASLTGATAVTDDIWVNPPSGTNFYAQGSVSGFWSVSTTTGLCTYTGPNQVVKATAIITVASAVAAQALELAVTADQALVGTSTADYSAAVANVHPTTAGLAIQLVTQKFVTMIDAGTLGIAIRDTSASNNITVSRVSLLIEPA